MATAIPWIVSAYSAYKQGSDQSKALAANSATYNTEAGIGAAQGYQAEAQQRRRGAEVVGAETAAAGQAGAGYGGSTGRAIAQSAMNTELDALNVRYKAGLQKWSYGSQALNLSAESGTAKNSGLLRAGAALLKGYGGNYTTPGNDLG